jgi:hypothetical protein
MQVKFESKVPQTTRRHDEGSRFSSLFMPAFAAFRDEFTNHEHTHPQPTANHNTKKSHHETTMNVLQRRFSERTQRWRRNWSRGDVPTAVADDDEEALVTSRVRIRSFSSRRAARLEVQLEDRICVLCQAPRALNCLCNACYQARDSPSIWNAWMAQEQRALQKENGCSFWNKMNPIYVHSPAPRGFSPDYFLLKRIKACIGWAVHGLILEFVDGTRSGFVVDVSSITNDGLIERRKPTEWFNIPFGDYVTSVEGFNLSRNCFLCHTIHLKLASGKTITFASSHEPWKGEAFRFELPENSLLQHVSFKDGKCKGITAVETVLHLPIQSSQRVQQLPKGLPHHEKFLLLQLVANRVDSNRAAQGKRPLGRDVWGSILYEFLAIRDLEDYDSSVVGKLRGKSDK